MRSLHTTTPKRLRYNDYILTDGGGWFEIKGFSIRIHDTDEGVAVDIYKSGSETEDAIASCYAFDSENENLAMNTLCQNNDPFFQASAPKTKTASSVCRFTQPQP
jgi:hypothetical protein